MHCQWYHLQITPYTRGAQSCTPGVRCLWNSTIVEQIFHRAILKHFIWLIRSFKETRVFVDVRLSLWPAVRIPWDEYRPYALA